MYIEIHNHKSLEQDALYFKLNNALNLDIEHAKNRKLIGVYAIFNKNVCLYVGQTTNLASRVATHLRGKYRECSRVLFFNIEEIGFSDFKERDKDTQKSVLDNCERYVMSVLKPVDNLLINMDFKLPEDQTPIIFDDEGYSSSITIFNQDDHIAIANTLPYIVDTILPFDPRIEIDETKKHLYDIADMNFSGKLEELFFWNMLNKGAENETSV